MTSRTIAAVLGTITLVMGLLGLASPQQVMAFLEFAPLTPSQPVAAWCEARAVYGGLFTVLGVCTLWGAVDPAGKRPVLLMAGLLWLGLCAGRSLGIAVDGSPGVMGWLAVAWEAGFGSALVWAAIASSTTPA
jgi:hypothetical protein